MARRRLRTDGRKGSRGRRRRQPLRPLLEQYLAERRAGGPKPPTIRNERWACNKMLAVTDHLPMDRETAISIFDGEYKGTSRPQIVYLVKKICRWLEEVHGYRNPLVGFKAVGERSMPRVLTENEIDRLMQVTMNDVNDALIRLLLDTGIRIGEALSLTKASIIWRGDGTCEIVVTGKRGTRRVPITASVALLLLDLGDETHIWPKNAQGEVVKVDALQGRVRRLMARAGITGDRTGPHTCRHTFGTIFIAQGGDIALLKDLLGHKNIKETQIYITLAQRDLQAAHSKYAPTAALNLSAKSEPAQSPGWTVSDGGTTIIREEAWICTVSITPHEQFFGPDTSVVGGAQPAQKCDANGKTSHGGCSAHTKV